MIRHYITNYYFSDGRSRVLLARIAFDGKKISFEVDANLKQLALACFSMEELEKQLSELIKLPITISKLRAKTLPGSFKEIKPDSYEHFRNIPRNTTYFKFTPIKGSDDDLELAEAV